MEFGAARNSKLSLPEKWEATESLKLCYRFLGGDHSGEACVRSRICGINNCKNTHNRLLHRDPLPTDRSDQVNSRDQRETVQGPSDDTQTDAGSETNIGMERNLVVLSLPQEPVEQRTERSHTTETTHGVQPRFVALRIVPVFLKNGPRRIKVNALLDEASTKTYLNADVAAELELQGEPQKVTVNVLKGHTETFETTPVEFVLVMLSDNGGNFVGANKELCDLVKELDQEKITKSTANQGINWKFNPPLAPHFGGVHESMIKAAKRAIHAILGNADITDEELTTAFTGAEALLNSRPLTYQSANPEDDVPLTPNHFLFGQIGGQFAPESVDHTAFNPKKRWRRVQELVRHFWHR